MIRETIRRIIASSLIWGAFLLMYGLLVGVLVLGICFTAEAWWIHFQGRATAWMMAYQSGRVILLALALIFVLAMPLAQLGRGDRKRHAWRDERRSGSKG